ncbi:MAG: rRNA biogenesis protein rrp5 [Anaerostipes sp.]|nr:rRNA biogenesis protein rrp5 [Anaerostipes sp.]
MSKVTAMLDAAVAVITDIRSLADSLQALVEAVSEGSTEEKLPVKKVAPKKKPAEEPKPEPQPKEEKQLTLEDVRAICADKSRKGFTAEVKAILTKHGADKLSEVDPAEYKALLAEVEVLGNAG